MRRLLLGSIAALALGLVSPAAFAADMAPPPAPMASWTGFYLGAGGGVGWADIDINHRRCGLDGDGTCDPDWDFHNDFHDNTDGNIIGVVQGGFDYEIAPSFVVGIGADWTFGDLLNNNNNHHDDNGWHDRFETDGSSMVDLYGRAGFAPIEGSLLVYGLVGWSWLLDADTNFRLSDDNGDVLFHHDDNLDVNGVTVGGGVEWKFTDNLSIRGEYRFTDLNNTSNNSHFDVCDGECWTFRDHRDIDLNVQRVLFTLNWRFGGFGATTAAAY